MTSKKNYRVAPRSRVGSELLLNLSMPFSGRPSTRIGWAPLCQWTLSGCPSRTPRVGGDLLRNCDGGCYFGSVGGLADGDAPEDNNKTK